MDPAQYRLLQLQSITGYSGTTEWEVGLVISSIYASIILWTGLCKCVGRLRSFSRLCCEYAIFVVPQIMVFLYPQYAFVLLTAIALLGLSLLAFQYGYYDKACHRIPSSEFVKMPHKTCITVFRGETMLMTIISILAVDFSIYPRRFVKSEAFGTSLMDVGVGCIIFSGGLVAGRFFSNRHRANMRTAFTAAFPLILIGSVRVLLVKILGYQEHITEYGVHWNFFITLALLPVLTTLLGKYLKVTQFALIGVLIGIVYQMALSFHGLESYIMSEYRGDLISMNKEGIFSLLGYLSLFLISCQIGLMQLEAKTVLQWKRVISSLTLISVSSWLAYFILKDWFGLVASRRLANTMTGIVNIKVQTLLVSDRVAVGILLGYTFAICFIAYLLARLNIQLKWK